MYAVIRALTTDPSRRDELATWLREHSRTGLQPVCFLVGSDAERNDRVLVTELWASYEIMNSAINTFAHQESFRRIAEITLDSEVIFAGETLGLESLTRQ